MARTMNLSSVTWSGVTFGGLREHLPDFENEERLLDTGASDWIEDTAAVSKRFRVEIRFNDQATLGLLMVGAKLGGDESSLVVIVKIKDSVNTITYTYLNAKLMRLSAVEGHNEYGVYAATFLVRSTDGTTSPVEVT